MTPPVDLQSRSFLKAVTYRILIVTLDFSVLYLLTQRASLSAGFAVLRNFYSTIAYYLHERVWNKIRWGKRA